MPKKNATAQTEPVLTTAQIGAFRRLLLDDLEELVREYDTDDAAIGVEGVRDRGEESVTEQIAEINAELVARRDSEIRDTRIALQRIDDGVYGICTNCGTDISLARLQAYPRAKRCINCKRDFEKQALD